MSCNGNGLFVSDGGDPTAPSLGVFCGRRFPWWVVTTGNSAYLKLPPVKWDTSTDKIIIFYQTIGKSDDLL